MKISTKGRYGLRSMIDLAVYATERPVKLSAVAARQGISLNYLEYVFSLLKKSGLVLSVKGPNGGYSLAKAPEEITIGQVLHALEGTIDIADELSGTASDQRTALQQCLHETVWDRMNQALQALVDSRTLRDMADHYRESNQIGDGQFYI
ncbi:MAG: Rrf2 family transcriptional regulator [Acidaminobacter sp.]|uniref:RrF2 family transcriptional regulator n=1 Tax=Acidaminobacter sp. TaxID=1872102 RepID=UPI0013850B6F|nr:Rrf2 family transcriptional regulator [Acidaminobacter sp.]MZQ98980.1 Rrf2 family transcriptional regulator [Acidaminobacter sp.]